MIGSQIKSDIFYKVDEGKLWILAFYITEQDKKFRNELPPILVIFFIVVNILFAAKSVSTEDLEHLPSPSSFLKELKNTWSCINQIFCIPRQ